jgi:hypothetical protein
MESRAAASEGEPRAGSGVKHPLFQETSMTDDLRPSSAASRSLRSLSAALLALAFAFGGCATIRGATARQRGIETETQNHVYAMSIGQLWPQIRKLMFENGFKTREGDNLEGSISIETEPKRQDKTETRYLLQVTRLDAGGARIEFTRQEKDANGSVSTERDLKMEWTFLQRADPAGATRIKQLADAEAERAKAQG